MEQKRRGWGVVIAARVFITSTAPVRYRLAHCSAARVPDCLNQPEAPVTEQKLPGMEAFVGGHAAAQP